MLLAVGAPGLSPEMEAPKRLNILLLMDDQHRGDALGVDGADWIETPNLDQLAREGALFTKMYSSVPSCLPARAGLLTGQSPWAHGLLGYADMAESYPYTLPQMLRDAGYRTHAVGKNHFTVPGKPLENRDFGYESIMLEEAWRGQGGKGFQGDYRKWFTENHPDKDPDKTGLGYTDHRGSRAWPYDDDLHSTNWTANKAIEFLEEYDEDRPWMMKVSFKRPHPPFDPPRRWMEHYEGVDIPMPEVSSWSEEWHGGPVGSLEGSPNAARGVFPDEEIRASREAYYGCISHVDEQIGRVVEALRERGELENTLIFFTSDHGDMMGDQNLWRKCYGYEGSARVPMIIRWPESMEIGAPRGRKLEGLAELRDVLPTMLEAAGIAQPEAMDGMSLLSLLRGQSEDWRSVLDLEHSSIYWEGNAWVALTDGRYKYIYFTLTGRQQLFDLDNDPDELIDLCEDGGNLRLVDAWRALMADHLKVRGDEWVKNGELQVLAQSPVRSPNYGR